MFGLKIEWQRYAKQMFEEYKGEKKAKSTTRRVGTQTANKTYTLYRKFNAPESRA